MQCFCSLVRIHGPCLWPGKCFLLGCLKLLYTYCPFHYTRTEYHLHSLLHHPEQDNQSNPKMVLWTMKIVPHPSGILTCITQGDVLEIFQELENMNSLIQLHHVLFLDHYHCFQLTQVITNFPLSYQLLVMQFLTYYR